MKSRINGDLCREYTDDGGSAHAASVADTLSSDMSYFIDKQGKPLLRFAAYAFRPWKMPAPSCKHGRQPFSNSVPCLFQRLCHVLLHRPAVEGHGRVIRRLGIKEQRFFAIMQFQLYTKLYFTVISEILRF